MKSSTSSTSYSHIDNIIKKAKLLAELGIPLKNNTTLTPLNWQEDMNDFIRNLKPSRWKIFQVCHIKGVNDPFFELFEGITYSQIQRFVIRHQNHNPIVETSEIMKNSYCMIAPDGRFYYNTPNGYSYSSSFTNTDWNFEGKELNFTLHHYHIRKGDFFKDFYKAQIMDS